MHTLVQFRSADESLSRDLLDDDTSCDVQKEKAWYSWLYCRAVTRSRAAFATTAVLQQEVALQLSVLLCCAINSIFPVMRRVMRRLFLRRNEIYNKLALILCYDGKFGRWKGWKVLENAYSCGILVLLVYSGSWILAFQRKMNGTDGGHLFLKDARSHLPNFTVA